MLDVKKIQKEAEEEVLADRSKAAKETIKVLLRKKAQAQQVVQNVERELADAYAELGRATI